MTGRIYADDWTTCAKHSKRTFTSRKAARAALRLAHPDDSGMREYPCDVVEGTWHYGHLPNVTKAFGVDPLPVIAAKHARQLRRLNARRMADVYYRRPRSA